MLQIRAGQWSITPNLWTLTAHIYDVVIIVITGFSKKSFYYFQVSASEKQGCATIAHLVMEIRGYRCVKSRTTPTK